MDSGGANLRTNDSTTKAGLPCDRDTWAKEECIKNPFPAVHRAEAGNAPSMANEELSVAWSRTLEFQDGSGRETDACSVANEALTA